MMTRATARENAAQGRWEVVVGDNVVGAAAARSAAEAEAARYNDRARLEAARTAEPDTSRQDRAVHLMCQGLTGQEIATAMGCSPGNISKLLKKARRRHGCRTNEELAYLIGKLHSVDSVG